MEHIGGLLLILIIYSYRTPAPLSYPPHIIALGSIYTAALLTMESLSFETPEIMDQTRTPRWIVELLGNTGSWEEDYVAGVTHVDGQSFRLPTLIGHC